MWNGAFSPSMTKRIGTVTLVPLDRMTDADYNWLDWYNLRNTAKNRLVLIILAGLVAFLDMRLDAPEDEDEESDRTTVVGIGGRAKRRYLYGATAVDEENFEENNHDFFRHEKEVDDPTPEAEQLDEFIDDLSLEDRRAVLDALYWLTDDELMERALVASDQLSDENFWFLAAIVTAHSAAMQSVSFQNAANQLFGRISGSSRIAAGRGL